MVTRPNQKEKQKYSCEINKTKICAHVELIMSRSSLKNCLRSLFISLSFWIPATYVYLSSSSLLSSTIPIPAIPISSLDPVTLVEGQSYRQAASCRSVARPPPRLSWDTELNGQSINRSSDNGAVSSHFSLHPLRSMNGKKLDCLVWHPTSQAPRRLSYNLVVHCEYSELYRGNATV